MSNNVHPLAHRVEDACRMIGVGRTSLYRLISQGKLRTIRIAGRTLVSHREVERLIAEAENSYELLPK